MQLPVTVGFANLNGMTERKILNSITHRMLIRFFPTSLKLFTRGSIDGEEVQGTTREEGETSTSSTMKLTPTKNAK